MTSLSNTPNLVIIQGTGATARYPIRDGAQIGRDPSSDIQIEDDQSSRLHMHIQARPDGYWAIDQNSTNGTYVNDLRINQPVLLRHGDVIRIGETQLRFELEDLDRTAPHDRPLMPTQVQDPAFSVQPRAAPAPQPQAVSPDLVPPPAPVPVAPAVETTKRKRRWWVCCLLIPLIFVCGITILGGGGYYLYTNGTINQRSLLNLVGQGPGEISLINISDGNVYFAAVRLDTEDGEPTVANDDTLEPLVIGGFGGLSPGQYRLEIEPQSGVPAGGDCLLEIKSGDKLQFVVVPEGISVIRDGYDPLTADEMILETSPLCQGLR